MKTGDEEFNSVDFPETFGGIEEKMTELVLGAAKDFITEMAEKGCGEMGVEPDGFIIWPLWLDEDCGPEFRISFDQIFAETVGLAGGRANLGGGPYDAEYLDDFKKVRDAFQKCADFLTKEIAAGKPSREALADIGAKKDNSLKLVE